MNSSEGITLNYEEAVKLVKLEMEREEEMLKYILSLFSDDEDKIKKYDDWEYSGLIKPISEKVKKYDQKLGEGLWRKIFLRTVVTFIRNIENYRMIYSALKVYGKNYGKDNVFLDYYPNGSMIAGFYFYPEENMGEEEWKEELNNNIIANLEIISEYIESLRSDKNASLIRDMMDKTINNGSEIYDKVIERNIGLRLEKVLLPRVSEAAKVRVGKKLGYKIKGFGITEDGMFKAEIEEAIEKVAGIKTQENRNSNIDLLYV